MIYVKSLFACVVLVAIASAQIPNFGRCPEYGEIFEFISNILIIILFSFTFVSFNLEKRML